METETGKTVEVNGVKLWYRMAGEGPMLVMQAPGWGIQASLYENTMKALEEDFTVLYYDTRGVGRSQKFESPEEINVGNMVEDLEALRKELNLPKFVLMGHSDGSYIALNYALKYQEHLSHLILVGGMADWDILVTEIAKSLERMEKDERYAEAVKYLKQLQTIKEFPFKTNNDIVDYLRRIMPLYFHDLTYLETVLKGIDQDKVSVTAYPTPFR